MAIPTAAIATSSVVPDHQALAFLNAASPMAVTTTEAISVRMEWRRMALPGENA